MKKTTIKEHIEKQVAKANTPEKRKTFQSIRKLAVSLAECCDFAALENIKQARAGYTPHDIIVCARFKDVVERCQIITSFTYGALLHHLSGYYTSTDDCTADGNRSGILTMTLSYAKHCPLAKK